MTSAERVAKGAELLDLAGPPNWALRIDGEGLDLDDGWSCVLGQIYSDMSEDETVSGFEFGCEKLGQTML